MLDTRLDWGEDRWVGIGLLEARIVIVVFTRREDEILCIISMRKATEDERNRFERALQDKFGGA